MSLRFKINSVLFCRLLQVSLIAGAFQTPGIYAQTGCTDPLAVNYNPNAQNSDGSCMYKDTIIPVDHSTELVDQIKATSGLIFWNDLLITHNDSNDENLYGLDPDSGEILKKYYLEGTSNKDWEAIDQDEKYIYVGDFGNNAKGNRTDLNILRIDKNTLEQEVPEIDSIQFSYEDQANFNPQEANTTDYDCEAFFVTGDSIYLVTKQWTSMKSAVYVLPKTPGTYKARLKTTLEPEGLVTDATLLEDENLLVLSGYDDSLMPFLYLIYDFNEYSFSEANKRKLRLDLPITQVEGLTTTDGITYYFTNEYFSRPPFVNSTQRLHTINLKHFLTGYLDKSSLKVKPNPGMGFEDHTVFPVPANEFVTFQGSDPSVYGAYSIFTTTGQLIKEGNVSITNNTIDITRFKKGMYLLKLDHTDKFLKIVKR